MGYFGNGQILVLIHRGDYFQCGLVIAKGSFDGLRRQGLARFRERVAAVVPFVADALSTLAGWDAVKLLTVRVDHLRKWYRPGLLCIGDAAHAMSPIGGVGINLAIQDAVAAANLLAAPLRAGRLDTGPLRQVQRRRELPARLTQRAQVLLQNRVISPVLGRGGRLRVPLPLRLLGRFPWLRRIPAHLIGIGLRPEHVERRKGKSLF
jgi:2-polyprenyl-6-methoxyphenol hydroxylase-like FAD-dependent oxidoreductase